MDSYVIGNIVGRILMSYTLIFLVLFFASRANFKLAFDKSTRWYGVLSVIILFVLGISVRAV